MAAIRNLIRRYPAAAIAVVGAIFGLGGLMLYQSQPARQPASQAPTVPPGVPAPITPPTGSAVTPTPTSPGSTPGATPPAATGAAPAPGGATPGPAGAGSGATPPETTGEGRANPFEPLVGPPGSTPAPGGPAFPPVPPLQPSGPAAPGQGTAPAAPPAPQYRVVGFVWGDTALAILEDGRGSYIVGPGDTVAAGTKVVAIDVRREVVRLDRDGTPVALTFAGPTRPTP